MPAERTFDARNMEDVMQAHSAGGLDGRAILGVVSPLVQKFGDAEGSGYERGLVICKAGVVV